MTQVESVAGGKTYKNTYTYENDRIKTVSHNTTSDTECDVTYTFNYDSLGRKTEVKVGQQLLSRNVYENDRSGMLKEVQYGNGGKVGYEYDEYDRLTGVKYDGEATPRYTYEYGANGQAMRVEDKNLNRVQQVEYDLAERPMQKTIRDLETDELIYRTTLQYDGKNRLKDFSEQTAEGSHRTSYTYDKDDRTTAIQYDDANHKVEYTYDTLNRITNRKVTNGEQVYETTYGYVSGDTEKYGTGATTPLISTITQGADANAMNFAYEYDSRGNIVSENRNGDVTTYSYDALGQLIRVNDPHENATWVYNYDRGGNITSKVKYAYTTGTLGTAQQTIPYEYDTVWKDKLVKYNGKSITYDAIGNPLNDGDRRYTWGVDRQLRKVTLPATLEESMNTTNGVDTNSNARLKIVFDNVNVLLYNNSSTTASAHVYIGTEEITSDIPAANFKWEKVAENGTVTSNWKTGVKSVSLTQADLSGATEIRCEVTRTSEYGTVQVDNSMMASHTPAADDANDRFSIENGNLMLNTTDTENLYIIEDNCLKVEAGLGVDLTAKAVVYPELPDKVVEFKYNADGLRTQKKVILPSGRTETTEYILHGKMITEMRKGENIMHFFYDSKSKVASLMYNGIIYTYVYNLQGDIVSLIDGDNSVVEYNYDVWGRLLSITGTLKSTLGKDNPFRYRGYMYDEDIKLYYLKSRDYSSFTSRFINLDSLVDLRKGFMRNNMFAYGRNNPITFIDPTGHSFQDLIAAIAAGIVTATNVFIKATELFTGGKKYPLYQPPSNKGPILSPIYKTIATGKSTVKLFFHELVLNTPFQLEEGCTFASGLNI